LLARYRRVLRRGDVFPPIFVARRSRCWGGGYDIVDGAHRFHAHRLEGRKTIRAIVVTRWIDPASGRLIDVRARNDEMRRALIAFNPTRRAR